MKSLGCVIPVLVLPPGVVLVWWLVDLVRGWIG